METKKNTPKRALLIVDVQNDFCPGGALAVKDGDRVVPVINRLMDRFELVISSQDWHPRVTIHSKNGHHTASPALKEQLTIPH